MPHLSVDSLKGGELKARRIGIALGLVFAMVLALSQIATAAPATTYDIKFDGYCDGLQLNIPSVGLGGATVDGHQTGCVSGGVIGTKSTVPNAAHLITYQGTLHTQVNSNHTWVHYGKNGNLITLVNSGTWSFGPPRGTGSPASNRGGGARAVSAPATTYQIHLDGYCDGMDLNIPSMGLGTPDTVDGSHTGCIVDGLWGTKSSNPNAAHITTNYAGFWPQGIRFLINANHTWTIYYDTTGTGVIGVLNSGTWSFGPPRGGGRPAALPG